MDGLLGLGTTAGQTHSQDDALVALQQHLDLNPTSAQVDAAVAVTVAVVWSVDGDAKSGGSAYSGGAAAAIHVVWLILAICSWFVLSSVR